MTTTKPIPTTEPPITTWTQRLEQLPFLPMLVTGAILGLGLGWVLLFHLPAGSASFAVGGLVAALLLGGLLASRVRAVARWVERQASTDETTNTTQIDTDAVANWVERQASTDETTNTTQTDTDKETTPDPESDQKPAPLLDMLPVAGGEFMMGSAVGETGSYGNERPRHLVRLEAFLLARTPVTRRQYRSVMGDKAPNDWPAEGDPDLPANYISWNDAVDFCNALSEEEGLQAAYDARRRPIPNSDGYRLPTEAEWEYTCRAGQSKPWFWGDDADKADDYAWFNGNSNIEVHPVGRKTANPWGFYDLSGNVWEWCQDCYADYGPGLQVSPTGPESVTQRVLRGGSAWNESWSLRSAYRDWDWPGDRGRSIGFRCARARAHRRP